MGLALGIETESEAGGVFRIRQDPLSQSREKRVAMRKTRGASAYSSPGILDAPIFHSKKRRGHEAPYLQWRFKVSGMEIHRQSDLRNADAVQMHASLVAAASYAVTASIRPAVGA